MIEMMTLRKPLPVFSLKKIILLISLVFPLFLVSCSTPEPPRDEAGALRDLVRETRHSFENPLYKALNGNDGEEARDLLEKIRLELSVGRNPANYAAGLLDRDGVVVASVSSGSASPGIFFSRYESFRQAMTKRKILPVRFYLQGGDKLMTVMVPIQKGGSVHGVLAVAIFEGEMKDRWGLTEEGFLSLDFNR